MNGQMGDQPKIGAFAHHGRPAVAAGRSQTPGDDGAGNLVGG